MQLPRITFHGPRSFPEALGLLRDLTGTPAIMGGGTDLLVRMKYRLTRPSHLISLRHIPGTDDMREDEHSFFIGPAVTLGTLVRNRALPDGFGILRSAAALVATNQIRNMATLAGNLLQNTRCAYYNRSREWQKAVRPCFKRGGEQCHAVKRGKRCLAVYQGDMAPVLAVLEARALIASPGGTREIPVEGLFSGHGVEPLTIDPSEILTGVTIPKPGPGSFTGYRKYRIRDGMDYPLAGAALSVTFSGPLVESLRLCLTGVSPAPVMVTDAADAARGQALTPSLIEELADRALRSARPIGNLEGEAARRREMVRHAVTELLREGAR